MKNVIIFFSLLWSISGKSQRVHDVYNQDLYKLIQVELKSWASKGFDVINDSRCNIQAIRKVEEGRYVVESISKKTFQDRNTSMIQVPTFDSIGEITGSKQVKVNARVTGLFCSNEMTKENKLGLIFCNEVRFSDEDSYLNGLNNFIIISPKELNVINDRRIRNFMELITSIDFRLDSCMVENININGKDSRLNIFPLNFYMTDTIGFIHELTDKLFKNYNSDFNKAYYTKGISNYMRDMDKYGNDILQRLQPERDTLDILDVTTDNYKKAVLNTLEARLMNSVSFCFFNQPETGSFRYYVGAGKNVLTSGGIDLGYLEYFLDMNDARKLYSKTSNALVNYLLAVYQ